jgi:uncharacterized phiE125 gp8 family phage protein
MRDVRLSVVVPPAAEPVSLAEIWTDLRLDPSGSPPSTFFDAELNALITAAREYVEKVTRRALVTQTCAMTMPAFPGDSVRYGGREYFDRLGDMFPRAGKIEIARPPLQSVTSIEYFDRDGAPQTVSPTLYRVINRGQMPGTVELVEGASWPETEARDDAVTVTYVAGYPGSGSPQDLRAGVPQQLKSAIRMHVRRYFNANAPEDSDRLDQAISNLCGGFRVERF